MVFAVLQYKYLFTAYHYLYVSHVFAVAPPLSLQKVSHALSTATANSSSSSLLFSCFSTSCGIERSPGIAPRKHSSAFLSPTVAIRFSS